MQLCNVLIETAGKFRGIRVSKWCARAYEMEKNGRGLMGARVPVLIICSRPVN